MNNWKKTTVDNLIKNEILYPPKDGNHGNIHPKGKDFIKSGVPFIMASDLKNGGIDLINCSFISKKQAETLQKGFARNGDILLSHKATLGRVAEVNSEYEYLMLTPQVTYYRVKDKQKLDQKYLKYYFISPYFQKTLKLYGGNGSTRDYIGILNQKALPVILPPLQEQKAIAKVLSSLDDKIELLRKQNETLEKTAQTIFKEWFVNFNFPDKDGKPYKDNGGKMDDSEMGEIPERWRVGKIYEGGKVVCGKTPSKANPDNFGGNIPFIKIPDMHNQLFVVETDDSLTNKGADSQTTKFIPANSICVSCIATVGLVVVTTEKSQTNQQINSVIPINDNLFEYMYFSMKLMNGDLQLIGSGGTATLNVNTGTFMNLELLLPDENILKFFHERIKSFFEKIKFNTYEIQTLTKTRDTILPKLMSGEVVVN